MNTKDLLTLPDNLPIPEDDGACEHLEGMELPSVALSSTLDRRVDLSQERGVVVVYFFPKIGRPDAPPMTGWNEIPGARGCTPQSCAFRDQDTEFRSLGVKVYGVSSQSLEDQKEAAARLHLPFELLSDSNFLLANALQLPTFEYNSLPLIKRLTIVTENGAINKVFYPVFPPNENAANVITWLKKNNS